MKRIIPLLLLLLATAAPLDAQNLSIGNRNDMLRGTGMGGMNMGTGSDRSQGSARLGATSDSLGGGHKQIPRGVRVWSIDKRFGDIQKQQMDTVTHMFQNSIFTNGLRGEYNTLGNLGTPRINRIFIDRAKDDADFLFTQPYSYFDTKPENFLFTNTLSPYTNLTYSTCGNRMNGEDHFKARFAVNAGKNWGFGFHINYLYGRGYYSDQSTSLFNINLYGSYIGEQYQAHLLATTNSRKITENGGITNDNYITHPESFDDSYATSEIPTMLSQNWNRNSDKHLLLSHRYNVGFHRQVRMSEEEIAAKKFALESQKDNKNKLKNPNREEELEEEEEQTFAGRPDNAVVMGDDKPQNGSISATEKRIDMSLAMADSLSRLEQNAADTSWMKSEYVPVTSFIHTAQFDTHNRIYQAHRSPEQYYAHEYINPEALDGSKIFDETDFRRLRNTFAISLLEGFNKWVFAGLKVFATSDLRHYTLPDEQYRLKGYTNHNFSIGGQMSRQQGKAFHYNITAETWLMGDDLGQVKIDGNADFNFKLLGDTVTLGAKGFFHNERANYYLRHYHSRHFWWDNDLSMMTHTHLEGNLSYQKTRTSLRFGVDEMTNYTYLAGTYTLDNSRGRINNNVAVRQSGDAITLLTASLKQDATLGPLNWENVITWQKSTKQEVLPVPALNIYTNLYLKFRIAKVLYTELGVDMRYFTEYEAPDYAPGLGQFVVQENEAKVKVGNYPIINAYANFNLKGTRFFLMYTHVNAGSGNKNSFLTPHYPLNNSIFRMGLSWNFFN